MALYGQAPFIFPTIPPTAFPPGSTIGPYIRYYMIRPPLFFQLYLLLLFLHVHSTHSMTSLYMPDTLLPWSGLFSSGYFSQSLCPHLIIKDGPFSLFSIGASFTSCSWNTPSPFPALFHFPWYLLVEDCMSHRSEFPTAPGLYSLLESCGCPSLHQEVESRDFFGG